MRKRFQSEIGFTLLELLVAINLAFITLTLVISFYLFAYKFTYSSIKKIELNGLININMTRLEDLFKRADSFRIIAKNDSAFVIFGGAKSIIFSGQNISLNNSPLIRNIGDFSIHICRCSGDSLLINYGINPSGSHQYNTLIESADINYLRIDFVKDGRNYSFRFDSPAISTRRFKNI